MDGFGISNIIKESLQSIEDRCNIYSIIGSSVLRYGSNISNSLPPPIKDIKSRPSTTPNRKRISPRSRAQTTISNNQQVNLNGSLKVVYFIYLFIDLFTHLFIYKNIITIFWLFSFLLMF